MKRIITKIVLVSIFLIFAISLKSFAESTLRFYVKDGVKVDSGAIVEVPIIIDGINIQGIEKKIFSFSGTLEYDETVFELVPYQNGDNSSIVKVNPELEGYGIIIKYNNADRTITTTLDYDYISEMVASQNGNENINVQYLNNYIQIGTIKVKAKEDAKPGDYLVTISNISANNSEFDISGYNNETKIHVNEILEDITNNVYDDNDESVNKQTIETTDKLKKPNLNIEVSKDGKQIIITPDEEKGAIVNAITYRGKELEKKDGKFIFSSEPNNAYEFFIYGADGVCYGNEIVTTMVDVNEEDENTTEENKTEENIKKSPQTGDYIAGVAAVLHVVTIAACAFEMTRRLRKIK